MNAKVLLVDDEPAVLKCMATALSRLGHAVTAVTSGAAALDLLARHTFDLVVTDFRMPEITGETVVRAVRQRQDGTAVMLTTGLVDELPDRLRAGPEAVHILPKPFNLTQLQREVQEILQLVGAVAA